MKHVKLFEEWKVPLNEDNVLSSKSISQVEESIKLESNEAFHEAVKKFHQEHGKAKDEQGTLWSIMFSDDRDARHYSTADEDEDYEDYEEKADYDLEKQGYKIAAASAVEALVKLVMMENGDGRRDYTLDDAEIWGDYPVWSYEGEWHQGSDYDKQADWFFDDGCVDGDEFHWKQYSIKKIDEGNSSKLAELLKPGEIAALKAYIEKYGGSIAGRQFGI